MRRAGSAPRAAFAAVGALIFILVPAAPAGTAPVAPGECVSDPGLETAEPVLNQLFGTDARLCVTRDLARGSNYDPVSHTVYLDARQLLDINGAALGIPKFKPREKQSAPLSPVVLGYVLGHEWAHAMQHAGRLPVDPRGARTQVYLELQADCVAGYLLGYSVQECQFGLEDIRKANRAARKLGDPLLAHQSHGRPAQRQKVLDMGIERGIQKRELQQAWR